MSKQAALDLVVLSNVYPPEVHGGYELLAAQVVEQLRARGHSVRVLTSGEPGREDEGVSRVFSLTHAFPAPAPRSRARLLWCTQRNRAATERWLERARRPDATLVMSLRRLGLGPLRALEARGIPAVLTVNDDWPAAHAPSAPGASLRSLAGALLDRTLLRSALWRSQEPLRTVFLADSLRAQLGPARARLPEGEVCAQGVDLERFTPRPFEPVRAPLSLLFTGRVHPSKGVDLCLDALASLRRGGVEATLSVAGGAAEESYRAALEAQAAALGITPFVRWLGALPHDALPELYRSHSVHLCPFRWEGEGMGLTWLEALASGTPVVLLPAGGARMLWSQRRESCSVPEEPDGEHLAREVLRLLEDPALARRRYDEGLALVRGEASLARYVDALEAQLLAARAEKRGRA